MKEGTVKFFNDEKGFGFITPAEGGDDLFVHISGCVDEITKDDKVQYEVGEGRRGPNAINVKVVD